MFQIDKMNNPITLFLALCFTQTIFSQTYTTVATFAGTGIIGLTDAPLATAQFYKPYGVCSSPTGTIYVADTYNHCIRKLENGIVTTIIGNGSAGDLDANGVNARLSHPTGVYYKNNILYICDNLNNKIKQMDAAGNVTTIAGSGAWTFADGPAASAAFKEPKSLVVDNSGVIYVADYENHCVRKIANGQVTTLAGLGGTLGDQLGTGTAARFHRPRDLAIDFQGNLYVVDLMNHKVKVISPAGAVTLLAGSGLAGAIDATGSAASFNIPVALDWMPSGDLCVLDAVGAKLRKVTLAGVVTTIAGSGSTGYVDGPVALASFSLPQDICFDPDGNLYVGDNNNHVIRILSLPSNPKSIEETVVMRELTLYPNPTSGELFFELPEANGDWLRSVTITSSDGKLWGEFRFPSQQERYQLNTAELPPGSYFLLVTTEEKKQYYGRFIKH